MALYDRAIVRLLPAVPKPIVRRLSAPLHRGREPRRRVPGREGAECGGKIATVDVLGEELTSAEEARGDRPRLPGRLGAIERERLDSTVSVKPTAFGLELDYDLCRGNVSRSSSTRPSAATSSASTWRTRPRRTRRFGSTASCATGATTTSGSSSRPTCAGRSTTSRALADLTPNVRLCKGIYVEPPSIAYREFEEVRANFVEALGALLDGGSYVGIATHDEWLIGEGCGWSRERSLEPAQYEFQMLLGVREERADELVAAGHRLRVYVPFGERWYEYSLRRLQENPKIAGYVAADTLGRFRPRRNGSS